MARSHGAFSWRFRPREAVISTDGRDEISRKTANGLNSNRSKKKIPAALARRGFSLFERPRSNFFVGLDVAVDQARYVILLAFLLFEEGVVRLDGVDLDLVVDFDRIGLILALFHLG